MAEVVLKHTTLSEAETPLEGYTAFVIDSGSVPYLKDHLGNRIPIAQDIPTNFSQLDDVDVSALEDNFVPHWDETTNKWVMRSVELEQPPTLLSQLSDVDTTNLQDTNLLQYSTDINKWRATNIMNFSVDANYVHTQLEASTDWTVNHPLGKRPSVTIVDSGGNTVVGSILYVSSSEVVVHFNVPFAGKAYLN